MSVYALKPLEIETHYHSKHTDVILRKNIRQVEQTPDEHGDIFSAPQLVWECEEKQFRYPGNLSVQDIEAEPEKWWSYIPKKINNIIKTPEQRLHAIEIENIELKKEIEALKEEVSEFKLTSGGSVLPHPGTDPNPGFDKPPKPSTGGGLTIGG